MASIDTNSNTNNINDIYYSSDDDWITSQCLGCEKKLGGDQLLCCACLEYEDMKNGFIDQSNLCTICRKREPTRKIPSGAIRNPINLNKKKNSICN